MGVENLARRRCQPCGGDVPPLTEAQVRELLLRVPEWHRNADGKAIRREWRVKDFITALDFFAASLTSPRRKTITRTCI